MFMSGFGRRNIFKSIVLYLCVSALFILPISTLLTSLPTFAAGYFDSLSIQEKYKFYVYARVIDKCLSTWPSYKPNIQNGNIFSSGDVYVGTFPGFTGYNASKGSFNCGSKELLSEAVNKFGIKPVERATAAETLFCYMGYRRASQTPEPKEKKSANDYIPKGDSCTSNTGEQLYHPDKYKEGKIFESLSVISGYKIGSENSDPSIKYLVSRSMIKGCIRDEKPQSQRLNPKDWEIPDVDSNGNLTKSYYLPGDGQGYNVDGIRNREWPQDNYDAKIPEWQCMNIYQRLVESAPKYQEALKQSATDAACAGLAGEKLKACKDGASHKSDSKYCETTYGGDEEKINACKQGQTAKIEVPAEGDGEEPKNSCGIDGGLGWLICPVMTFVANINDAAYGAISGFLDIKPAILSSGDNSGAKQGWDFFRNIANAIFAVIFLWIIFSQISNVGVSNYGIKKILPRLIIGALLVNLSYYLCQIFVDLSNILGHTLKDALESGAGEIGTTSEAAGWGSAIAATIVGVGGVAAFAALAIGIPTLVAGFLAIMTVFIILVVRQAGIILLISMSPIAFAAWLLPNTEDLFKKWMKMFRGLLLVFPIISLLYGAGKLAGAVLAASATVDPNNPDETMHLVALAAATMPLIATPFVLQNSLSSLGSIGAKIGKLSSAANGNLKNAVMNKSRISDVKNAWKSRSARKLAERRSGNTWWGRNASNLRGSSSWLKKGLGVAMNPAAALDNNWVGKKIGLGDGAGAAQEAYDKAAMEKAERALTYKYGGDAAKALNDKNADKYIRIAAVNQLKGQGTYGADKIAEYLNAGGKVDSVSMAKSLTDMKGSHAGVAKAGSEALQELQKEGGLSEINFSSDQFKNFTASGVSELSNKDIAGQSAKAIEKSNITADKATEILSNDILYSSANDAVISALKKKGGKRIISQTPQDNQNNQQGNNSQQSSQNNQQNNSSSGG